MRPTVTLVSLTCKQIDISCRFQANKNINNYNCLRSVRIVKEYMTKYSFFVQVERYLSHEKKS